MRVKDVMTSDVVTVGPNTRFKAIAHALLYRGVSGAPVVDEGSVIGVVTEGDLIAKTAYPTRAQPRGALLLVLDRLRGHQHDLDKAEGMRARDLMSAPAVTATPGENVHRAARRMLEHGLKRLPVVDEKGTLVGIVSRRDLLTSFDRSDDAVETEVVELLRRAMYVPPDHEITVTVSDGIASLTGTVYFRSDVAVAGALVDAMPGVVGVRNFLGHRNEDPRARML